MPSKNTVFYSILLIIADFIVLLLAFTVAYILRVQFDNRPLVADVRALEYFGSFLLVIPFWILIFVSLGLYQARTYNRRLAEWGKLLVGSFIGILLVIGWEYVSKQTIFPARLVVVYAFVGSALLLIFEREIMRLARTLAFRFGRGTSRVLVVGNSNATRDIITSLDDTAKSGYNVVAVAGPHSIIPRHLNHKIKRYSSISDALKNIIPLHVTTIIQTDLYDSEERNQQILSAAQTNHISYSFIPGEAEFYAGKNTVDVFLGYPMITVSQTPLIGWGRVLKRVFDFVTSLVLLVLLSPLLLLLCLMQKVFNRGPIFYVSKRLSQFSRPVKLIKFRSMGAKYGKKDAAEEFKDMGRPDLAREYKKHHKVADDPRITRFGKFLRDTSLDELPQIFNVLRGDLSLVGPRPILPQEVKFSPGRTALLHSVKSGVTGLWQVSGRSNLSFEERIELELFYAQNWSFWLDIKILFKTIGVVLRKTGAK